MMRQRIKIQESCELGMTIVLVIMTEKEVHTLNKAVFDLRD